MASTFRCASFGLYLLLLPLAGCAVHPPPMCPDPQRREALQEPLHAKELGLQQLIDTRLQRSWPFGSLVNVIFEDDSMASVTGYDDTQDSAIWTGIYAAAQAFRYAATPADRTEERQAALAAIQQVVMSLHTLAKVPGYAGGLARVAASDLKYVGGSCYPCTETPCYTKTYDGNTVYWLGKTSRDQYTGWFFGMAIAYRLVDDPGIRATIREDVQEMITGIRRGHYKLRGPDGQPNPGTSSEVEPLMRLTWHLIAASILDEPIYWKWYREQVSSGQVELAYAEDSVAWTNRYYQYYGFNLSFLNSYNLIVLEPDPGLRKRYLDMFEKELYRHVEGTENVFFDYIAMAVRGQASPGTVSQDREALRRFPGPPSVWSCVQPPARPLSLASKLLFGLNRLVSRLVKKELFFPQARNAYPLDQRCRQDFLWQQTPYAATCCCCCSGTAAAHCPQNSYSTSYCPPLTKNGLQGPAGLVVYPGVDYLAAYWMGRHHGFLRPED